VCTNAASRARDGDPRFAPVALAGFRLGGFRNRAGTCNDLARARAARTNKAVRRASDLRTTILEIQNSGAQSLCAVASGLNQRGITAPRGGAWHAAQVKRVLSQLATTGPVLPGGLNRSTQHFILEGKDGVWDGSKVS
jgi:hypothetical protein